MHTLVRLDVVDNALPRLKRHLATFRLRLLVVAQHTVEVAELILRDTPCHCLRGEVVDDEQLLTLVFLRVGEELLVLRFEQDIRAVCLRSKG